MTPAASPCAQCVGAVLWSVAPEWQPRIPARSLVVPLREGVGAPVERNWHSPRVWHVCLGRLCCGAVSL